MESRGEEAADTFISSVETSLLLFVCGQCVRHRDMCTQECALCGGRGCLPRFFFTLIFKTDLSLKPELFSSARTALQ